MFPGSRVIKSTIGRRLRQARERARLLQDRQGVRAGLDESSSSARMSRYNGGVHEPPMKFSEALAKALGVPVAFFYCSDDRLAKIILACSDASEAKRQVLLDSARSLVARGS